MTKSEIIKEMQENFKEMELIIQEQKIRVEDAYRIMKRYGNMLRCAEDLEKSRDNWKERSVYWKNKFLELEEKKNE